MIASASIWYVAGFFLLLFGLYVLARPLEILLRLAGSSLVGGLGLLVLNWVGGYVSFHIGLNPVSAFLVGVLGIPGLMGMGMIQWLLG